MQNIKIINLTLYSATPEQIANGVVDFKRKEVEELLTFNKIPTQMELRSTVDDLVKIARSGEFSEAMLGHPSFISSQLETRLIYYNIQPLYSFYKKVEMETDGMKYIVRVHAGWIKA